MKNIFCIGFALTIGLLAAGSRADEIIDSGWVEMKPSELENGIEGPRVMFSTIKVIERPAIHTDALSVIRMQMDAANKVDYELYFDIDVVARDESGDILFVMKLSPDLLGVVPGHPAYITQSRYVVPGTLDRVATYQLRFLGFK